MGIVLNGLVIRNLIVDGPAFNSRMLDEGDTICQINHSNVTSNELPSLLQGSQGSSVVLTVRKKGSEELTEISLVRVATSSIFDRCKMFELFDLLKVK